VGKSVVTAATGLPAGRSSGVVEQQNILVDYIGNLHIGRAKTLGKLDY